VPAGHGSGTSRDCWLDQITPPAPSILQPRTFGYTLLVAFSVVYTGVHWVMDLVAGAARRRIDPSPGRPAAGRPGALHAIV
jgi:hypothetical protein